MKTRNWKPLAILSPPPPPMYTLCFDRSHLAKQGIPVNHQWAELLLCDTKANWEKFAFGESGLSGVLRLGALAIINSESPTFQHAVTWGWFVQTRCVHSSDAVLTVSSIAEKCVIDGWKIIRGLHMQGHIYIYFFKWINMTGAVNRASLVFFFVFFLQPTSRDVVSSCAYMNIFVASNTPRRLFCSICRCNIGA